MKKLLLILLALCFLSSLSTGAQEYDKADPSTDFGARAAAGVDWKIAKGLHLAFDEELRFADTLGSFSKAYSNFGLSYKIAKNTKIALGYSFIEDYEKKAKHRVSFAIIESFPFGDWKLSVKEKIQMTNKAYEINSFEKVRNLVQLKSSAKIEYDIPFSSLIPYFSVELRNAFNGVNPESLAKDKNEAGTVKYNHAFIDRIQLTLGTEWQINSSNYLDLYILWESERGLSIDASASGTFKSAIWEPENMLSIGIAYEFAL